MVLRIRRGAAGGLHARGPAARITIDPGDVDARDLQFRLRLIALKDEAVETSVGHGVIEVTLVDAGIVRDGDSAPDCVQAVDGRAVFQGAVAIVD